MKNITLNDCFAPMKHLLAGGSLCLACIAGTWAQKSVTSPVGNLHSAWVDSVYNSLTPDQRIGQLIMMAAYSNRDTNYVKQNEQIIKQYAVGGVIFFQGGPMRQAMQTNRYQAAAQTPLLIGMDAEWGPGMRLDSCISFPRQMALGAIADTSLIRQMGTEIAAQLRRLGVQLNFAPVVDINNQPANPVIGIRAFGEDAGEVTNRSLIYMEAMQQGRVLTAAKHFPGHGNTAVDSHFGLPVISQSYHELDSLEWMPYKTMFRHGLTGVMVGHLYVPSLDSTKNLAASLSRKVITNVLRDSLGFQGLIYTDALNMKGVSKFFLPGRVEVMALLAGADVILMPDDVARTVTAVKAAVASGFISAAQVETSCRRILAAKEWAGLNRYQPVDTAGLLACLNRPEAQVLNKRLVAASLTVVQNRDDAIPLKHLDREKTAVLLAGIRKPNTFVDRLQQYETTDCYYLDDDSLWLDEFALEDRLSNYSRVIVGIHNTQYRADKQYGIPARTSAFIDRLSQTTDVLLCLFAPPYALSQFSGLDKMQAIVVAYQDSPTAHDCTAQILYGGLGATGRLPVSVGSSFARSCGLDTADSLRLRYSLPEEVGISSKTLMKIDTMVWNAIDSGAMPGCQVLAALNGTVFLNREYGTTRFDRPDEKVCPDHIYDLASVTKVAAALPSVMFLLDRGELSLRDHLSKHLKFHGHSEVKDIALIDLLTHQAGLPAYIPFHRRMMDNGVLRDGYFEAIPDERHHGQTALGMFVLDSYRDTMFNTIKKLKLSPRKQYLYSDLGFILLSELVERRGGVGLNEFTARTFYRRLGAGTTGYLPYYRFPLERIVPTANDTLFRKQWLQGFVHDENAALLGGVSGHAGLFSNANDLAKLFQMYLNKGTYGGERFIDEQTMEVFTACPFCQQGNRRGIGFDKPEPDPQKPSPAAANASPDSYGHSGFTGTYFWIDPQTGLLFIFLSNRVCPNANNNILMKLNLRTRIFEMLTEEVKKEMLKNDVGL